MGLFRRAPLCIDCRWCHRRHRDAPHCHHPKNIEWDPKSLVTGDDPNAEPNLRWTYCATQRSQRWPSAVLTRSCGRSGRWFKLDEGELL